MRSARLCHTRSVPTVTYLEYRVHDSAKLVPQANWTHSTGSPKLCILVSGNLKDKASKDEASGEGDTKDRDVSRILLRTARIEWTYYHFLLFDAEY